MVRVIVAGFGRSGKDEFSNTLSQEVGLKFISSSEFVGKRVIYPKMKETLPNLTWEQCFNQRHKYRKFWYDEITTYNTPDRSRLGSELFQEYDIYCGLRNIDEFNSLKNDQKFDISIWIEATERLQRSNTPLESKSSITITPQDCDIIIENNGTYEEFKEKTIRFSKILKNQRC